MIAGGPGRSVRSIAASTRATEDPSVVESLPLSFATATLADADARRCATGRGRQERLSRTSRHTSLHARGPEQPLGGLFGAVPPTTGRTPTAGEQLLAPGPRST